MTVTIQLDLPDARLNEARAAGLLESARLADWLADELRRKRARVEFGEMLKKLHSVDDEPMSLEEIQAEVDAVREERRRRESGR
jgi:aminoglycoside phosphotransferase (APT) family kinase protein